MIQLHYRNGRLSHLPERLHAAPPLTREEARTLGWEYVERRRRRQFRLAVGLLVAGLAGLVWSVI